MSRRIARWQANTAAQGHTIPDVSQILTGGPLGDREEDFGEG